MSFPAPTSQPAPYTNQNYQQALSPSNASPYAPPPAKRQRLSPDVNSPDSSYTNGISRPSAATSGYGNPYAPTSAIAHSPYSPLPNTPVQQYSPNTFNTPNPYPGSRSTWQAPVQSQQFGQQRSQNAGSPPSSQMMPPPPRPNREEREEKVGVDDINDALFSSGINLKDEENYMHNMYNNRHSAAESFQSQQGSSFASSTVTTNGSFSLLTQGTSFNSQPNGTGSGTLGATVSQDDVETEIRLKRTAAARKKAELDQHHLKNPFLLGNVLRLRCDKLAKQQGVRLDVAGMYVLQPETPAMVNGAGTEGVVAARAGSMIEVNAPFTDILGLLSLASGERIRGLLDDSYTLARARRYADHGRVPPDFKDIADAHGEQENIQAVPESITGTSWDQPGDDAQAHKPQSSIAFQSVINRELRSLARKDEDAEKARLQKREARRKAAEAAANGTDEPSAMDTTVTSSDGVVTAGTPGAESTAINKISKKELARQQKERANATEAQAATTTNQTAAMMALGGKRNRYSWMSGGTSSMPTNRFAKPTPASSASSTGTTTPVRKDGARSTTSNGRSDDAAVKSESTEMTWGAWRENSAGGRGIQVRDWLLVLERDGKEKKAFQHASLKLGVVPPGNQS